MNSWQAGAAPARVNVPDLSDIEQPRKVSSLGESPLTVSYRRSFNRPTGLSDRDLVFLVCERWTGNCVGLSINGHPLVHSTTAWPTRDDLTEHLRSTNEVEIVLRDGTGEAMCVPRLTGEVRLSIETR